MGELGSLGGGRFRIEGAAPDAADSSILAVTAGGQDLVPANLPAGILEKDGAVWRLRDPPEWPREVTVSVFTFGDELLRLLPR
jgi:hypothetical protein